MAGLSVGTGLISGINSAALIEQLLALESRGKAPIQRRIGAVTAARTALLDVNARLLAAKSAAGKLRTGKVFDAMKATLGDDTVMSVSTGSATPQGNYQMRIARLVSTSQLLSRGFASTNTTPAGLDALSFELGRGGVENDTALSTLNNGDGVRGGKIRITDRLFKTSLIDLSAATTMQEVVDAINADETVSVSAAIEDERLVVRDTSGGGASFIIDDVTGTLAEDLGIEANVYANSVTSVVFGCTFMRAKLLQSAEHSPERGKALRSVRNRRSVRANEGNPKTLASTPSEKSACPQLPSITAIA